MDNENTVQTEQATTVETSADLDAAWDSGWEDDGQTTEGTEATTAEESEGTEADADQQTAEGTEGEQNDGDSSQSEAEGNEGQPDQAETFTLRHLGEERTVDREEVVKLAQQGMDYPRIREKWDAVKDDVPRLRMYEGFLKELAESRGGDIDALIDETRTRSLLARAKARGERLEASAAAAQAVQARLKAMEPAEAKKAAEEEELQMQRRRENVDRFFSIYGNEIKAEDIPKEVWDEAEKSGDLVNAYQRHLNTKLEAENKKLQKELEQTKLQQKNKARSMGSSQSTGAAATKDPFDEGWNEAW